MSAMRNGAGGKSTKKTVGKQTLRTGVCLGYTFEKKRAKFHKYTKNV